MQQALTKRQAEILSYIRRYVEENGYAPSYREIGQHFGLSSTATIAGHIDSLKEKGYIFHEENLARSVQLNPFNVQDEGTGLIPLLGSIAAGKPIEAIANPETIDIPRDMMGNNVFALKVKGESMVEDGIMDGDYIIVESGNTARNGDIVVALVDDNYVTLKRFYKEKDHIRLQPANSAMRPILLKQVAIQGKVRGLIRRFV